MRQVTIPVYKYYELSDKAKKRALDDWRYEKPFHFPFFEEDCKETAKEFGFEIDELQYSLSYCQGDGLSFSGQYNNIKQLFVQVLGEGKEKTAKVLAENVAIEIKGNTGRYCFASKYDVDLYVDSYAKDTPNVDSVVKDVLTILQDSYIKLCNMLEQQGYDTLDYENSEAYFAETCEANEWEFYEDGEFYS